jgi:hypothetical protein
VGVLFYLWTDGQYILLGDTLMAVCFVDDYTVDFVIDSGRSFLLNIRWTIYFSW